MAEVSKPIFYASTINCEQSVLLKMAYQIYFFFIENESIYISMFRKKAKTKSYIFLSSGGARSQFSEKKDK